jgi:Holliday junction resolvase RusA-like endonuclease
MSTSIDLPLPPSTNRLWRSGRGRVYRSKRYMVWCRAAGLELALRKPARTTGAVVVTIAAGRPDKRRRDIDNLAKSTLDLLVAHQVIEDDAKVVDHVALVRRHGPRPRRHQHHRGELINQPTQEGNTSMSFGKKVEAAVRALKSEDKLPPGLRPVERNRRVLRLGHDPRVKTSQDGKP